MDGRNRPPHCKCGHLLLSIEVEVNLFNFCHHQHLKCLISFVLVSKATFDQYSDKKCVLVTIHDEMTMSPLKIINHFSSKFFLSFVPLSYLSFKSINDFCLSLAFFNPYSFLFFRPMSLFSSSFFFVFILNFLHSNTKITS